MGVELGLMLFIALFIFPLRGLRPERWSRLIPQHQEP